MNLINFYYYALVVRNPLVNLFNETIGVSDGFTPVRGIVPSEMYGKWFSNISIGSVNLLEDSNLNMF